MLQNKQIVERLEIKLSDDNLMSAKVEISHSLPGQQYASPLAQKVFKQQNLELLRKSKHHWRQTSKGSNRSMSVLLHASGEKVS